ncbi:MAG: twin-arginine translocase TatA/TatE family subunit [Kiloniellales bacterium]|nr:twin-arginine translocase TatA/TatE family subunit [Kiloniellales bacterium]
MGTFSIWHWLIVLAVALLLFGGGGKIKKIMGDVGSGITAFKKGLKDGEKEKADSGSSERKAIDESAAAETTNAEKKDKAASG